MSVTAPAQISRNATTQASRRGSLGISEIVRSGACIGCGACALAAGPAYQIQFTSRGMYQAARRPDFEFPLDDDRSLAGSVCPFSDVAETEDEIAARVFGPTAHAHQSVGRWHAAYVGAVTEGTYRDHGSSGGMVTWLLAELLERRIIDGVVHVAAVTPTKTDSRLFQYRVSRTLEEVKSGAKSRYYPVEFSAALEQVRTQPGRYAFVGIPCFVKALRLLQRSDPVLRERITVAFGLFCGHLKSAALVESFARQCSIPDGDVRSVNYRVKQPDRRADIYTVGLSTSDGAKHERDWTQMVDGDWGMGFFQYSACNYCDDVMAETADVSFGDAWVKPYSTDGRGTNVVVARSAWINEVVQSGWQAGRLELSPVDGEFLARTQAAGLRQRREGLGYRLHRLRGRILPRKRVAPNPHGGGWKRRRIYELRLAISRWSHPVFALAKKARAFWIYRLWACSMAAAYRAIYWCDRGRLSQRLRLKFLR